MQIVSNCGAFVIDYYPVKSILTKNLIPDLNLKVVSNYGRTLYKELLNDYACGDDIIKKNIAKHSDTLDEYERDIKNYTTYDIHAKLMEVK